MRRKAADALARPDSLTGSCGRRWSRATLPRKQGEPTGVRQLQGDSIPEFTASEVLSSKLWQPRPDRPPLGIDLACTKIAVDFQNITAGNADAVIRQSLDILREATGTDAVFLALHGAMGTVEYRQTPGSGEDDSWYEDTRTYTGIGRGPASYQDRIRLVLVAEVDPNGRIKLPKQKRGAGW